MVGSLVASKRQYVLRSRQGSALLSASSKGGAAFDVYVVICSRVLLYHPAFFISFRHNFTHFLLERPPSVLLVRNSPMWFASMTQAVSEAGSRIRPSLAVHHNAVG